MTNERVACWLLSGTVPFVRVTSCVTGAVSCCHSTENVSVPWWTTDAPPQSASVSAYPHNTYHGPTKHQRPMLNLEAGVSTYRRLLCGGWIELYLGA